MMRERNLCRYNTSCWEIGCERVHAGNMGLASNPECPQGVQCYENTYEHIDAYSHPLHREFYCERCKCMTARRTVFEQIETGQRAWRCRKCGPSSKWKAVI